jgi:hypothetical protein
VDNLQHANWLITALFVAMSGTIVASILFSQGGKQFFIRRIPGLSAIEEAVGRATEMGRPIYFSPGLTGIGIITLQALAILSYIVRFAATHATRIIVGTADATLLPVAEESVREAYARVGRPEAFRTEDVRFVSDSQFAYALGSVGIMSREETATNFYFGQFFAEALILTENGRALGCLQVAGTPDPTQIPFFIATCDYVVIGDEYYAASAYLTREPTLTGSLVGQDLAKAGVILLIILGIGVMTYLGGQAPTAGWLAHLLKLLKAGS